MNRRSLNRALAVGACALAAATVHPSAALAQPDGVHRTPAGNVPMDLPSAYCGFPVHIEPVVDREYVTQQRATDDATVWRLTGSLTLRFTNTATGRSVDLDEGGPGWITFRNDGTEQADVQGRSFGIASPDEQSRAGVAGLFFVDGHAVSEYDASGLLSVHHSGPLTDGCALLS